MVSFYSNLKKYVTDLFAASIPGAKALCAHMSLIRTAIAHGLEPFAYIQTILERLSHCQMLEDVEKNLPWNFMD